MKIIFFITSFVFIVTLVGCGVKQDDTKVNTSTPQIGKKFEDGQYTYNSRFLKGTEPCEIGNEKCLSLEDYQRMCMEVNSVTTEMHNYLTWYPGTTREFKQLFEGGILDGVVGKWLGKEHWRPESGIIGACEVTKSVSGIFEGSSTRADHSVYASRFIVINDKVLLHSANPGSAWML